MTETSKPAVRIERPEPHILVVTIDRPEVHNAVNRHVALGLAEAVRVSEADENIWAVVLTGAGGRAFCAGADLRVVADGGLDELFLADGGFAGFVQAARTRTWIAAVEGFALAGGFEIALACDMIVAAEQAVFALPEVKRGLIASAGGVFRLARKIPANIANELIATGARLDCARAESLGLVNKAAPSGRVFGEALCLAREINENAPIAVRESLGIARLAADLTEKQLHVLSGQRQAVTMETRDFAEGPRAFLEKRKPQWIGA